MDKTIMSSDGVEVRVGDTVWLARDGIPSRVVQNTPDGVGVLSRGSREQIRFFSTRAAAIAARLQDQRINLAAIQKEIAWLESEAQIIATERAR